METKKLRLPALVAAAKEQLRRLKYTDITVRNYGYIWRDLLKFANETGVEYFSAEFGERFLLEKYGVDILRPNDAHQKLRPKGVMRLKRGVYLLADYQNYGNFKLQNKSSRVAMPEQFQDMVELFEDFCRERRYTKCSMALRMFSVKSFLVHLDQLHVRDLSGLDKFHVDDFMKTIVDWSRRTVAHRVAHVGQFLRLLHRKKVVSKDLSIFLPKVNSRRSAKLPMVWTQDQIESLLAAVDRANPIGKRDYAIVLLISTLGLREGDVRELKFENIDWKACRLNLHQAKTGQLLQLPLDEKVGNAIIEYLKFGRPTEDVSPYVFVRHKAPYGPCTKFYHLMGKYLSRARIRFEPRNGHGFHSLRHTLATRLLEQQVPLTTISSVLGHANGESTKVYLKVDLKNLRGCALNPDEVFADA